MKPLPKSLNVAHPARILAMGFFFTVDGSSLVNRLIAKITGGRYAHVGVWFDIPDTSIFPEEDLVACRVYFESYWEKDPVTGKNGVRGPWCYQNLLSWADRGAKRRLASVELEDVTEEGMRNAYDYLTWATREITYAKLQLFQNWTSSRLGIRVGRTSSSRAPRWTCSETAARAWSLAHPAWALNQLRLGDWLFDEMLPSGNNGGKGLYEEVKSMSLKEDRL